MNWYSMNVRCTFHHAAKDLKPTHRSVTVSVAGWLIGDRVLLLLSDRDCKLINLVFILLDKQGLEMVRWGSHLFVRPLFGAY